MAGSSSALNIRVECVSDVAVNVNVHGFAPFSSFSCFAPAPVNLQVASHLKFEIFPRGLKASSFLAFLLVPLLLHSIHQ